MTIQELQNQIDEADKAYAERRALILSQMEVLQKELDRCYARVGNVIIRSKGGTEYKLGGSLRQLEKDKYPFMLHRYATGVKLQRQVEVTPNLEVVSYTCNYPK